jgi:two-component sensor histidine kinase
LPPFRSLAFGGWVVLVRRGAALFLPAKVWKAARLIAELNHQINSPLAAIRYALYLASCRTSDDELLRYLEMADDEVTSIAATLRAAREAAGEKSAKPALRHVAASV